MEKSKTGVGVLFILLGWFFGLIAGLLLYAPESFERKSFVFGCKIAIWLEIFLVIPAMVAIPIIIACC